MKYRRLFLLVLLLFPLVAFTAEINRSLAIGMWRDTKGNAVFSDFELAQLHGERSFYEWSAQLPSGSGTWRWIKDSTLEITWSDGRMMAFTVNKLDAKKLVMTYEGLKEQYFFERVKN